MTLPSGGSTVEGMVGKDGPAGNEAAACKRACDEGALLESDLGRNSLVVVPTYNEAQNLMPLVERVLEQEGFDVLVIDDSSADGTAELADRLAEQFPGRISVLHRRAKLGLGSAITTGLRYALHRGYAYVFQMDADLSHDPSELPAMRRALERADIVVGSRYVVGAATVRRARHRELLSRLASVYARAMLGVPLSDPTGGYRGYRRQVLEVLDLDQVASRGYAVQIELNHRCHQSGFRFEELPIAFHERDAGRSKMSLGIVFEALFVVAALRLTATTADPVRKPGGLQRQAASGAGQEGQARSMPSPELKESSR
jgi:dolichol-phosphate mannosyltransferase